MAVAIPDEMSAPKPASIKSLFAIASSKDEPPFAAEFHSAAPLYQTSVAPENRLTRWQNRSSIGRTMLPQLHL
jgi:hypothetical protein